jgi:predicted SAM-dependent methyltransferase
VKLESLLNRLLVQLPLPIRKSVFQGNRFICPLCKSQLRTFLPAGQPRRRQARCPICRSLERQRFLWLFLQQEFPELLTSSFGKVIHVAPEKYLEELFRQQLKADYLTADLYQPDVDIIMDISDNRLADESVDLFVCSHVLEHVPEDIQAMREFSRTLKAGGSLIVMVPMRGEVTYENPTVQTDEDRVHHFGQKDHVRFYGMDIVERLTFAGFDVQVISPHDLASAERITQYGLDDKNDKIFWSRRK